MFDHSVRVAREDISSFSSIFAYKDYMEKAQKKKLKKMSILYL